MDGSVIQQPQAALSAVRVVLGVLPGLIFIISIIFSHRANLSRERFAQIKKELDERRAKANSSCESQTDNVQQEELQDSSSEVIEENASSQENL